MIIVNIVIAILVTYIVLGLYLYFNQRSFLYFPSLPVMHNHAHMSIDNEGEKIYITVTNPNQDKALIYFGGNDEAVSGGADVFKSELPNYTTYLVDYRGYGRSSGKPTEAAIFSDALAIYDYIKPQHKSISAFGRSLGTGVACFLASKREIEKMVLVTPYDSIVSVAQDRYPIYPVTYISKDKFDSLSRVSNIKAKTIILVAQNDKVVPPKHAYNLAKAFPSSQLQLETIKDTEHSSIAYTDEYHDILEKFFEQR